MARSSTVEKRRAKLVEIGGALPEVDVAGSQHLSFSVRKKKFAYYLNDHHGDGRIALACKVPKGEQATYLEFEPDRFFMPAYIGPRGWIALRLDGRSVDWEEVAELLLDSYRLTAPRRLASLATEEP